MTIGKRIKELRIKNGLTQDELAKRAGFAKITIRQYESDKRTPNFEKLNIIASALNVPVLTFYEDEENHGSVRIDLTDHVRQGVISDYFEMLNDAGKDVATDVLEGLTMIPKYQKEQKEPPQTEEPAEAE